jgi:hypothetical protein
MLPNLSLTGLLVVLVLGSATCIGSAKRPVDSWAYYYFDGHAFKAGQPAGNKTFIAVRENVLPMVATSPAKITAQTLPSDQGAIAGIAYIQSSGGKLAGQSGFVSSPQTKVQVSSGDKIIAIARTDQQGYFSLPLNAGNYTISCGMAMTEIQVEKGKTVLVPLRTGKRMVD